MNKKGDGELGVLFIIVCVLAMTFWLGMLLERDKKKVCPECGVETVFDEY